MIAFENSYTFAVVGFDTGSGKVDGSVAVNMLGVESMIVNKKRRFMLCSRWEIDGCFGTADIIQLPLVERDGNSVARMTANPIIVGKDDIDHGTILSCNNGESRTVRRVGIRTLHPWVNRNDIFVTKQSGRQNIAGIGETNSIDKEIERDGVGAGDMDAPRLWQPTGLLGERNGDVAIIAEDSVDVAIDVVGNFNIVF